MTDDRPLQLGELAEVESPEVVRDALRRFRRRMFARGAWILLAVIVAWALIPAFAAKDLPARFRAAEGAAIGDIVRAGDVDVILVDARRLDDDTVGVHFVARADALTDEEFLRVTQVTRTSQEEAAGLIQVGDFHRIETAGGGRVVEAWVEMPAGTPGFVTGFIATTGDNAHDYPLDTGPRTAQPDELQRNDLLLGRLVVDLRDLAVPDHIWRIR